MTDHIREASSSPQTFPSTSAASKDIASADLIILIEPDKEHPAVEPTEAPFFADDPYIDRLPASIVEFYLNKETISAPTLITVRLSIAEFNDYEHGISAYVHKRFDYDPETQEITFRMTTPTNDKFTKFVEGAILKELSKLDEGHSNFIAGIGTVGNTRIKLAPNPNAVGASGRGNESHGQQKAPNVQFHHKLTDISTVIFEVAYTQKAEELRQLAHEYIKGSGGMPFRAADKAPVNETGSLKLCLDDFAFEKFSDVAYKEIEISISYGNLCRFLDEAEELQESLEAAEVIQKRIELCREREISPVPPRSPPDPSED
ncbi:hypothetical protein FMUND_13136 [Fusarium mundagurra]|uniref:Uncharacterized protein n=1 Tax=Fusarium mundagurra TaxID=1567541 RepID=A0A8H6D4E2_9HYPO|nr:hypothetical protein FMUND_13136 [Fusarium mundagurra]